MGRKGIAKNGSKELQMLLQERDIITKDEKAMLVWSPREVKKMASATNKITNLIKRRIKKGG